MTNEKKHILILSSWYPTERHPFLGNFVERHASLLGSKYNVTLLNTESGDSFQILDQNKETYREIRSFHPKGKGILEKRKMQSKAFEKASELIDNVDLIIGHIALNKGLQFIHAKKKFKCPLILVEHGSYYRSEIKSNRTWVEKLIIRSTRRHLDAVVAVSEFLKKDLISDFSNKPITVIGNHFDEEVFTRQPKKGFDKIELLHVSTLDERTKNPEGIFCAIKSLAEQRTNFHLTIICDENVDRWKELSEQFKLEKFITFIGPLRWDELPPYYHNAHAFVLFSEYESFSIVLAEAWATGTPVITTNVGIAYNMPDYLGMQVKRNDKKDLVEKIIKLINYPQKFDSIKISEYAQQFNKQTILAEWSNLIERYA
jgi:glycosyltransferase involved in cell wall biosynthesis